jgi:HD-GYP domain-containing protein (c-di-GMP phosphodiesterase class II)
MSVRGDDDGTRWAARPALARSLRVAVFAAPVAAAVGVSSLAYLALGTVGSRFEQAWHLAVLLAASTATLVLVDRVVRRALPLVTLLELSLLFPDAAPSRFAVAREAIRHRTVEDQLARVREAGADPAVAAREILGLVAALRAHDKPTRGHAERVRVLTDLVAEAMNVPARDRDLLRWASILHDIGKLRVSPAILNKPGKPTDEEWALLRAHPMHGAQIAGALLPWLGEWGDVIVQHHERYDGTGYPFGLAGRDISLGGRIVAVADAYEVMTATRAYRRPISRVAAHRELVKWSGQQFDPAVVRAMVGLSAPRLRRAQGVLAWLSDVPMVASSYVPAATLARVVGAGALATGAATGVLPSAVFSAAGVPSGPVSAASVSAVGAGNTAGSTNAVTEGGVDSAGTPSNQADQSAELDAVADAPAAADTTPAAGGTAVETVAPTVVDPTPTKGSAAAAASPSAASPSSAAPSAASPSSAAPRAASSSSAPPKGPPATNPSGTSSNPRNSTVAGTVAAAASAVTGTVTAVTGTVASTVTAVTGTVAGVTSTVDTTVGALTGPLAGAGSSGSGPTSTVGTTVGATVGGVTSTATGTVTGVLNGVGGLLGGKPKKK